MTAVASTHRLLAAIDEFVNQHGRDPQHEKLVAAVQELEPQVSGILAPGDREQSPGRQEAEKVAGHAQVPEQSNAVNKHGAPEGQPKNFQAAHQAATEAIRAGNAPE